jgi:hypothetical protein
MAEEYNSLLKNNTWTFCALPTGRKSIKSKLVYRIKLKSSMVMWLLQSKSRCKRLLPNIWFWLWASICWLQLSTKIFMDWSRYPGLGTLNLLLSMSCKLPLQNHVSLWTRCLQFSSLSFCGWVGSMQRYHNELWVENLVYWPNLVHSLKTEKVWLWWGTCNNYSNWC